MGKNGPFGFSFGLDKIGQSIGDIISAPFKAIMQTLEGPLIILVIVGAGGLVIYLVVTNS